MADPVAVPAVPAVKPGWKTTEAYLVVLGLGALAWGCQQLLTMLPALAATPGVPGWVAAVIPVVTVGLAWIGKLIIADYNAKRSELKVAAVDAASDAAIAAGAAAAASPGGALAK